MFHCMLYLLNLTLGSLWTVLSVRLRTNLICFSILSERYCTGPKYSLRSSLKIIKSWLFNTSVKSLFPLYSPVGGRRVLQLVNFEEQVVPRVLQLHQRLVRVQELPVLKMNFGFITCTYDLFIILSTSLLDSNCYFSYSNTHAELPAWGIVSCTMGVWFEGLQSRENTIDNLAGA